MKTQKCHCCNGTGIEFDHEDVGAVLRSRRLKTGLRLKDVASAMGYTISYVSDLERGTRDWSDVLLKKYNKALK